MSPPRIGHSTPAPRPAPTGRVEPAAPSRTDAPPAPSVRPVDRFDPPRPVPVQLDGTLRSDRELRADLHHALDGVPSDTSRRVERSVRGLHGEALRREVEFLSSDELRRAPHRDRALETYAELRPGARAAPDRLSERTVHDLTMGVAGPGGRGTSEGPLSREQAVGAARTLRAMSDDDFSRTSGLLDRAGSGTERQLLLEAVNARSTAFGRHAVDGDRSRAWSEVSTFADTIRGTPTDELLRRTTATPTVGGRPDDDVLGQRTGRSCAPAVTQMLAAEADPIAAWRLTSADPTTRTELAREQVAMGESLSGLEFGRVLGSSAAPVTGHDYRLVGLSDDPSARFRLGDETVPRRSRADEVDRMAASLERGADIPIVAHPGGSAAHHAMLVTDVRGDGAHREFLVTDPQDRTARWVNQAAFLANDGSSPGRDARMGVVSMVYEPTDR